MSDIELTDSPTTPGAEAPAAPAEPQIVRMVIELGPNGLSVQGPINDLVVAYGLLELAKDSIRDHKRAQAIQAMREQQEIARVQEALQQGEKKANSKRSMRDFLRRK